MVDKSTDRLSSMPIMKENSSANTKATIKLRSEVLDTKRSISAHGLSQGKLANEEIGEDDCFFVVDLNEHGCRSAALADIGLSHCI